MPDGSHGVHCALYPHGGAAAERAIVLFPDAARIEVMRLATVLLHGPRQPRPCREAA
ncbi:hypothetical protein SAMN05428957_10862 [Oryzisolibacter propanilivorax]|uniref:Uncharacterized protein n=2 Tax=Oryzisolibacter propanilivorax TaxID=1527607 RepID=A0A1G9UA48_9BURK|nr:hypothetical protein SAMN05428957_10862 [Oryzisolibacter propanilivorax]